MEKEKQIILLIENTLKEKKMPKGELAVAIGCNRRTVYYWFEGKRKLSIDMADKILNFLGITVKLGDVLDEYQH